MLASALVAALAHAAPAAAPSAAPSDGQFTEVTDATTEAAPLRQIMVRLDDADLAVREHASAELDALLLAAAVARPRLFDDLMHRAIIEQAKSPQTPLEVRLRLIGALRDRFLSSPRAAIGMRFASASPVGVSVTETIPGFPCHDLGLLKAQDVIIAIDGVSLRAEGAQQVDVAAAQERVRSMILSHEPGESVRLSLLRPGLAPGANAQVVNEHVLQSNGQQVEVMIPLGTFGRLPDGPNDPQPSFESAWRVRMERLGLSTGAPMMLQSSLTPSDWSRRQAKPRPATSMLTVDATEQPGEREDLSQRAQSAAGLLIAQANAQGIEVQLKNGEFVVQGRAGDLNVINARDPVLQAQRTIDRLTAMMAGLDLQIGRFNNSLKTAELSAQEAAHIRERIERARSQRESIKTQLQNMQNVIEKLRND